MTPEELHAAVDAELGPCFIPDCPGSVWAVWESELDEGSQS
jgi:hypothetical protein